MTKALKIKSLILAALLCGALALGGCGSGEALAQVEPAPEATSTGKVLSGTETPAAAVDAADSSDFFSDRDLAGSYDAAEAETVSLDELSSSSAAVLFDGSTVTFTAEGVYLISGSLEGQLIIDADEGDKLQLVLDGVDLSSASSAAIYVLEADKVFITLAEGSVNRLSNGGTYTAIDDNNIDAVIFAKTDLTLNGSGTLSVEAAAGHGIVSKDELVICGGSYEISSAGHGLCGKDSVAVSGGSISISSGGDGIHADNDEEAAGGQLYIAGGSFTVDAGGDAISASGKAEIQAGSFTLSAGGGSSTVTLASDADGFGMGRWNGVELSADTESCKGIKSGASLSIRSGSFTIDTADDAIHAAGLISIEDGDFQLRSGDDAIHSDSAVSISGGSFTIPYCYEGIEGQTVDISGGNFDIVSSDDGLNAAGGADGSGMGRRADQFAADSSCHINVSGGSITIVSDGDCLDSNGDISLSGGTLKLSCKGNGNTAIDCNGSFSNSGAELSTNDGSESGGGMPGAGMGHGGMRPDSGDIQPGDIPQGGTPPEGGGPGDFGGRPGGKQ